MAPKGGMETPTRGFSVQTSCKVVSIQSTVFETYSQFTYYHITLNIIKINLNESKMNPNVAKNILFYR